MILMSRIAKIMIFTLFTALPVMAQTATDLQVKYGPPSAIYEISPSISLTAKFAQDCQACEMLITEKYTSTPRSNDQRLAPELTALDVLNNIIPENQRGAKINRTSTIGNCFDLRTDLYEKVTISHYERSCESPAGVRRTVQILWNQRPCQGGETVINTRVIGIPVGPRISTPSLPDRKISEVVEPSPCGIKKNPNYVHYKRIYRKYEVSQPAVLLLLPQPELTPEALAHKATGKLIIEVILNPCGEVTNFVKRGHVSYGLTDRAFAAASKIKFKPAINDGQPVAQRVKLEYSFYLCDKSTICTRVTEVVD